jgi:hypothetical protein
MGYKLMVNLIQRAKPHHDVVERARVALVVALQVEFERQTLKPVFPLDRL